MPDTMVWVVGRLNEIQYPNTSWKVHPDGDLEITRGRTNIDTIAIFARGQWQWVESVKR